MAAIVRTDALARKDKKYDGTRRSTFLPATNSLFKDFRNLLCQFAGEHADLTAAPCFLTARHVSVFQSADMSAHSKFGHSR